jgi:hypothetical protein
MADHAYSNIALNGDFSADGEYFLVTLDLNGVPIRFGNVYVGDQREAFQAAKDAGEAQPQAQPVAQ